MSGSKIGGLKAAQTNKAKHGDNFYKEIGAVGGAKKVKKGFAVSGKASEAGRKGGLVSKRGPILVEPFNESKIVIPPSNAAQQRLANRLFNWKRRSF